MKYYISDLHFGHKNILKFDERPFFTLQEMKEVIIENWNSCVQKNDEVYILGDMFWYNDEAPEILKQLKGKKYLILGNHDRINVDIAKYFVWCDKKLVTIKDGEDKLVLCHFPLAHWDGQEHTPPVYHLYGHIHQGRDFRPFERYKEIYEQSTGLKFRGINVGCMLDYMGYTPRTFKYLKKVLDK